MSRVPRTAVLAVALLSAPLFFSACKRGDAPASAVTTGKKILRIGNGTEPQELDPHVVSGVPEHHIISALLEGLVTDAPEGAGVAPGVAESWEISPDGLVYVFHLRANARWSNGDPVTSRDFARSFQRILTPSLAAEYAYKLFHLVNAEAYYNGGLSDFSKVGVETPDARTLVLRLAHRTPFLLEALKHFAWFPVHIATLEKFNALDRRGTRWTRPGSFVGNGPFTLAEWLPNQKITVEKSATYWDAAATRLDAIEFHAIDNPDSEERLFRTGRLDATSTLPLNKTRIYREKHPESYRQSPYYGVYYYRLNTTRPPLNDRRVRLALAIALDREAIVENILRAGQTPAYNFTPPSPKFTSRASIPRDLALARELLAEAGYPGGKNFPRMEILYNTSESHRVIAEALQQMWRENLGIAVELNNQEWQTYLGTTRAMEYDMSRAGWIGDYDDPNTFLDLWLTGGGNNQTGFSNAGYDAAHAAALNAPDEATRMALFQKLEQILAEEVPCLPLYFYTRVCAISPRVKNWNANPLDTRNWKHVDLAP
ncbi:MAG: peptide ABC transporter substrate-binding protein [Opitutaceae bacterium]|jgi:oligopeptide transport system substrate-binding protein|nr:peptide ABC transporter substrate-binding protein [Opitutaceae bacterium]